MTHNIGTKKEWLTARFELLKAEKEYTRRGDELSKKRQELPWVRLEKNYIFAGEKGNVSLKDLFQGRSQLLIYHFMFGPEYNAGCPACSITGDSFDGVVTHLRARDNTLACVSRAPIEKLLAYRERMGWSFDWASSQDNDFNVDFGVALAGTAPHDPSASSLEANEISLLRMLHDQPSISE